VLVYSRLRWLFAVLILLGVTVANVATFPQTSLWRDNNQAFTTAEIIQDPPWVKGTATLLAAEFDSVKVYGLASGQETLLFDSELAAIYGVEADSAETAIDLIAHPEFAAALAERGLVQFEFETFCRVEGSQYCPLALVWESGSKLPGPLVEFETVRIAAASFALIEKSLLKRLASEFALNVSQRVPK